jgi:hypothetical protein
MSTAYNPVPSNELITVEDFLSLSGQFPQEYKKEFKEFILNSPWVKTMQAQRYWYEDALHFLSVLLRNE